MEQQLKSLLQELAEKSIKILIIEDHGMWRCALHTFLKGYFKKAFFILPGDWQEAENALQQGHDLVFLDGSLDRWIMPTEYGACGANLIPLLKKGNPEAVIISCSMQEAMNEEALKKGGSYACVKEQVSELIKGINNKAA